MSNKYKVCVYAICKNEEKFVDRFMDHFSDADVVIVVDTGSTDNTINKLKERGAIVYSMDARPFRFDYSRNECLKFIPDDIDICVSADLDDVIESGWRKHLENAWTKETTRGLYLYNWKVNDDGSPAVQYTWDRIHARHGYRWIYPTHEILEYLGEGEQKQVYIKGMVVNHYPDKTKNRSLNLPLLKLAIEENPNSSRNTYYLGREYMFERNWDDCILTLKNYLSLPTSNYEEERASSMRFIARAYCEKGEILNAKKWYHKAISESISLREPYIELSLLAYREKEWLGVYYYATEALKINKKTFNFANDENAWDYTPYDLAALGCYNLNLMVEAIEFSEQAIKLSPNDKRLLNNHKFYLDSL
ncbi:glycosyl transferase family 2 [Clostridium tagluense]|uniref:tetratricopeptide repeat-containing glycosyltransferase n=1 Tax=Clostridium tagluense TaxID=360422 RepID=UPI001CF3CE6B|nr:glycosyltransferase [Clostridium tagluense]MCB2313966.1 glycosyl transferase family 2 [Clostridium tagluense]MCB2319037.1 glycosyl transferase family 2 [Clostridium tagluense]MCB2323659.1 glycosyl transferase family 2 [Clostridium tagluense]MCB2328768.1 glycosyl transferase family 2 [Clostridium tagluense]MCB2333370.1 glycosyl transferase family 2 [Clostridium tagluense]